MPLWCSMGWFILSTIIFFLGNVPSAMTIPNYVLTFAPELRFDRAAKGYPMSAQVFYEVWKNYQSGPFLIENTDRTTLAKGTVPTYYQIRTIGKQIRINYWWFYGYQHPCFLDEGAHNGDWEHVMVILTEDRSAVAAISFYQHGQHYTRIAGPRDAPCTPSGIGRCSGSYGFYSSGTHPVVYAGKLAHGSFHDRNAFSPPAGGECAYYGDFRNPESSADYLQTWKNLIDLDGNEESWIAEDRTATWVWGPDGVSKHPTQHDPADAEHSIACEGSATYGVANAGCYQSECLSGDDETATACLKECKVGYVNIGLYCQKGRWPWEMQFYNRLSGSNSYSYSYTLPHEDVGLSRRRDDQSEWQLP
ncbi:unnamed protein product [Rotaria sp. Silwood1]|nr:unnamed protein product [Rotaria sp. Silwood1]